MAANAAKSNSGCGGGGGATFFADKSMPDFRSDRSDDDGLNEDDDPDLGVELFNLDSIELFVVGLFDDGFCPLEWFIGEELLIFDRDSTITQK